MGRIMKISPRIQKKTKNSSSRLKKKINDAKSSETFISYRDEAKDTLQHNL